MDRLASSFSLYVDSHEDLTLHELQKQNAHLQAQLAALRSEGAATALAQELAAERAKTEALTKKVVELLAERQTSPVAELEAELARARSTASAVPELVARVAELEAQLARGAAATVPDEAAERRRLERLWALRSSNTDFRAYDSSPSGRVLVAPVTGYSRELGDELVGQTLPPREEVGFTTPHLDYPWFGHHLNVVPHTIRVGFPQNALRSTPAVLVHEARANAPTLLGLCFSQEAPERVLLRGTAEGGSALLSPDEWLMNTFPKTSFYTVAPGYWSRFLSQQLLKLETESLCSTYKFGVMRWCAGQDEDAAMANSASAEFDEFCAFLGDRVSLVGWDRFRGGLTVTSDVTGTHSVYTTLPSPNGLVEIMFHVCTLLPNDPSDPQKARENRATALGWSFFFSRIHSWSASATLATTSWSWCTAKKAWCSILLGCGANSTRLGSWCNGTNRRPPHAPCTA